MRLDADVRTYLAGEYPGLEFQGQPIVLFQLLSHRSGLPFVLPDTTPDKADEVLRGQTITQPLGMVDTAIVLTAAQRARLAKGYDGEGRIAPANPDEFQGAAALKSTLADMLKYTRWPEIGLGLVVLTNAEDATASSRVAAMANQILHTLDARSIALP